jgi:hypothetical protein
VQVPEVTDENDVYEEALLKETEKATKGSLSSSKSRGDLASRPYNPQLLSSLYSE